MALHVYRDSSFNIGSQVDLVDLFSSNGVDDTFVLTNKTVSELGQTVQFGGTQYYQYTAGFTKTVDGFQLDEVPPPGLQGIAPGLNNLLFDDVFDTDSVDGVSTPRVQSIPFYIGDVTEIHIYKYEALPSLAGIELSLVDNISSYGAQTSWIQLACAAATSAGAALTYQATGTALYTAPLSAFGTLLASANSGASSVTTGTASSFIVGDYVIFNIGNSTQEVQKVIGYTAPNTLLLGSTLNFQHLAGEGVWACGRKFWMECTVPLGATGGEAASLYDLSLRNRYVRRSRL